jgi:hypothetical protein
LGPRGRRTAGTQLATWVKQAAALPGWGPVADRPEVR